MKRLHGASITLAILAAARTTPAAVDFVDQDLSVDLATDPATVTIRATVHVSVTTDSTQIQLLEPAAPLVSVEWDGTPLTVEPHSGWVGVVFPSTVTAGTEGTLTAVMSGAIECPYPGGYETCVRSATLTFLTPPWAGGSWYLINVEGPDYDTHTGSIEILQPTGHRAAAMGVVPAVVDNGDGTSTWTFAFDRQVVDLAFVAGELEEVTAASGGFPVRGLYRGDTYVRDLMQGIVDSGSLIAPVFGDLWGEPPVEEIQYSTFSGSTPFAGTSLQGLILLHEMIFTPTYSYIIPEVSHELAHLWWGTMSSAASETEFGFFAESMAEYSMWRARGMLEGESVRDSGSRMNAVWYMYGRPSPTSDTRVLSRLGTEIAIFAIYHKGSTVVRTLEEAAGADGLDAGLSAMIEAGPDGASIAGFEAAVLEASGVDLAPYVDVWLRGLGFPIVTLSPSIAETSTGYSVTVSASGDDFPMPLPVVARLADGTTVEGTLGYFSGAGEVSLETSARPAVVEVDPGWTAVRELAPSADGDVSLDGRVDGADLIEVALRAGGFMPDERRVDGGYDPLYDLDDDGVIGEFDLDAVVSRASE